MAAQNNIRQVMERHRLIPVVTVDKTLNPVQFMLYLLEHGIQCIEVTLRTPEGALAIQQLKKEFGSQVLIGAGTVLTPQQVINMKDLGADFLVSPGLTPALHHHMEESGLPYLPGVATPGEVMAAMEMGLNTLKFFPANLYGGQDALRAFGNLFPNIRFCPTGGIKKDTSETYLSLDNVFAVGGSWFQSEYKKKEH